MEDNLCTGGLKQTSSIFLLPLFKNLSHFTGAKILSLKYLFNPAIYFLYFIEISLAPVLWVVMFGVWVSNKVEIASWDILHLTSANCHYVRWQSLWFIEAVIYYGSYQRCNPQRGFLASNGISLSAYCSVAPWPIILSWLGYAILSRRRSGAAAAAAILAIMTIIHNLPVKY